jgi:L-gulonolactone oxidase
MRNFGGNVSFDPAVIYKPCTEAEVLKILAQHRDDRIRCVGSLHSWSELPATERVAIDVRHFADVQIIGSELQPRVQVGAGCTIKRLLKVLRRHGRALPTVGGIVKQTIGGATATGTHGSGASSLSHFIDGVRLARYDPESGEPQIVTIQGGEDLLAARCSLGFLGVVLRLVLRTVPLSNVEERFEKTAWRHRVLDGRKHWPLQQFAWVPWSWAFFVWRRRCTHQSGNWLWRHLCRWYVWIANDVALHALLKLLLIVLPAGGMKTFYRCCVPCLARFPTRVDDGQAILTSRHDLFRHVEMELVVPADQIDAAMKTLRALVEQADGAGVWTHHYPIIFRYVEPDETLISMASGAACYSISLFSYRGVGGGFGGFARGVAERMVAEHGARLHWGKYFPCSFGEARGQYPAFDQFEEIRERYDRGKKFWSDRLTAPPPRGGWKTSAAAATPRS